MTFSCRFDLEITKMQIRMRLRLCQPIAPVQVPAIHSNNHSAFMLWSVWIWGNAHSTSINIEIIRVHAKRSIQSLKLDFILFLMLGVFGTEYHRE